MNFKKLFKLGILTTVLASGMSVTAQAADCILTEHKDFSGAKWEVAANTSMSGMAGWNDYVSSVWVRNGYRITIHVDSNYNGARFQLYGDGWTSTSRLGVHHLGDGVYYNLDDINWNDQMSSFRCERE